MNLMRFTVIDARGGVSFVAHGDALPALVKACGSNPATLEDLLRLAEPYYRPLREHVLNGLAIFDERNAEGHYEAVHQALSWPPHQHPVFRVVDDLTRETSLRPVKAGAVIFNLRAKRIVQIQNSYREIQRQGVSHVFDGTRMTDEIFSYRLPNEWSLVP